MGLMQSLANMVMRNQTLTTMTEPNYIELNRPRAETILHDYSALYSIAYLACEQTKARSLGSLPVAVYRKNGDARERVSHPLADLLAGQANDLMSGRDLRHWIGLRRDTFGNAFVRVEWDRDVPVSLWPVTSHVRIDFDRTRPVGMRVRYMVDGGDKYTPAGAYFSDEMLNIRTAVTKDGVNGQSVARLAAHEVGLSVDLERFYSSMLSNGNHQLGHVELPADRKLSKEDFERLKNSVEAKRGVEGAGKTPIFAYGAKWVTDQQTMKDASLIEQQSWVLEQVCRACNVPPWKVYDNTGATYDNAESQTVGYVTDTVMPEAAALEAALRPVLQSMGQPDLYVKLDLNGLMRGDKAAQGQYYREMVYMGAMTRNEVRAKEEMNPLPGLDKPLVPVNYGILEPDGTVTILTTNREPADGMQTHTTD